MPFLRKPYFLRRIYRFRRKGNLEKIVERKIVGSKGEILPSKKLREVLRLKPGSLVEIKLEDRSLVVEPVMDPLEELDGVLEIDVAIRELKRMAEVQVMKETVAKISRRRK